MKKILPSSTGGQQPGSGGQVFSEDKLKLRANNMRVEWSADPNKKELLMSIDEVLASPNASKIIVSVNIDYAADCKATELKSIITMLDTLHKSQKVTQSDIQTAMTDMVEFVDSFACDNPKIFDYIGDLFCAFANSNILTLEWLCACTSRVGDEGCKPKVIAAVMKSVKTSFGDGAVRECFGGKADRSALESLLGAATFSDIAKEFL